jgi:colicin import membrane protein
MNAAADRSEFLPPAPGGTMPALALAVLAHLLLVAALAWGLRWKSSTETPVAEAELWASVPQQAAPRLVEAPPVAPPPPRPAPPPPQAAPQPDNADIVRERERKQLEEKKRQEVREQELRERDRKLREQKAAQEKQRALEAREKEREQKEKAEKLAQDKKREEARRDEARRQEQLREQQEAKRREEDRQANLKRMAGLAGASGSPSATGTATQSAGPSASYGSRVAAKVKPNIVFTEDPANNPQAELEVRTAPDGTIVSRKLLRSSGNKAWDEAVLRAIDKTETLPRDTDGRVPALLVISFRPKD